MIYICRDFLLYYVEQTSQSLNIMDYNILNLSIEKTNLKREALTALGNCFEHVTLSYKFYWMMALIQKVAVEGVTEMPALHLAIDMIGMAWQPVCKHQIGLGYKDGFKRIIEQLRPLLSISVESRPFEVTLAIRQRLERPDSSAEMKRILKQLLVNVPYCYLQPWTDLNREECIAAIIQSNNIFRAKCTPYMLTYKQEKKSKELWVHVHPAWVAFIRENTAQLYGFALAGLQDYVSSRNPEVQSVQYMLDWRIQSEVHEHQLFFWNQAIQGATQGGSPLHCLFTQRDLLPDCYRLDHYMPPQFAEAERLWSIFPADLKAPVSSTGNHYQDIPSLLPRLAGAQQASLKHFLQMGGSVDFLAADYGDWGMPVDRLATISVPEFTMMLRSHFSSATSHALNRYTGFHPTLHVNDDPRSVTNIRIEHNNGPLMGGTSNIHN